MNPTMCAAVPAVMSPCIGSFQSVLIIVGSCLGPVSLFWLLQSALMTVGSHWVHTRPPTAH